MDILHAPVYEGRPTDTANRLEKELCTYDLLKEKYIGCQPCINTSSLRIGTKDLIGKFLPAVQHKPVFLSLPN